MNKTFVAKSPDPLFEGQHRTLEQYVRELRRGSSPTSLSEKDADEGPRQMEENEFSVNGKD